MTGPIFGEAFRAELAALFRWRRDVRRFSAAALPDGAVERLLAVAQGAPSVGLSQPWRWVLVEDGGRRAAVRAGFEACNTAALAMQGQRAGDYARLKLAGLDRAPVHLAVFVDPDPAQGGGLGRATMPEMAAYSAVLAVYTLWLAARAEGIGVGWVSILAPEAVRAALDVPETWRLVAYLCLGWPEEENAAPELEREGWEVGRPAVVYRR